MGHLVISVIRFFLFSFMEYVYILKSQKDGKMYTGWTNDLQKRFLDHNNGKSKATKWRIPLELIYYEACLNREDAKKREVYLKTAWGKRYIKNRLRKCLTG